MPASGNWTPLGNCIPCCGGGGSGSDSEIYYDCSPICDSCDPPGQLCDICVTINECKVFNIDDTLAPPGEKCDEEPYVAVLEPWTTHISYSFPDPGIVAFYSQIALRGDIDFPPGSSLFGPGIIHFLRCNENGTAKWHVQTEFYPKPPCILSALPGGINIPDEIDGVNSCTLEGLLGNHVVEENQSESGITWTVRLDYTVTAGRGCGVLTSCCPRKISKHLVVRFASPSSTYFGFTTLQWDGSKWVGVGQYISAPPGTTINALIIAEVTCNSGTLHAYVENVTDSIVHFDDDLTTNGICSYTFSSGIDGVTGWGAEVLEPQSPI